MEAAADERKPASKLLTQHASHSVTKHMPAMRGTSYVISHCVALPNILVARKIPNQEPEQWEGALCSSSLGDQSQVAHRAQKTTLD